MKTGKRSREINEEKTKYITLIGSKRGHAKENIEIDRNSNDIKGEIRENACRM